MPDWLTDFTAADAPAAYAAAIALGGITAFVVAVFRAARL